MVEFPAPSEEGIEIGHESGVGENVAEGLAPGVVPGQHGVVVPAQVAALEFGAVGAADVLAALVGVGVDGCVEGGDFARGEKACDDQESLEVEEVFLAVAHGGEGHLFVHGVVLWVSRMPRRPRAPPIFARL